MIDYPKPDPITFRGEVFDWVRAPDEDFISEGGQAWRLEGIGTVQFVYAPTPPKIVGPMTAKDIVLRELAKSNPQFDVYEESDGKAYVIFEIDDEAASAIALVNVGLKIVEKA